MSGQKSKEHQSALSPSFDSTQSTQRLVQNFFLVWIDPNIDQSTADFHNALAQLRSVVNDVTSFRQQDEAIDFLTDIHEMSGFLIITGAISQQILPLIHDIKVLDTIYILTTHPYQHEQWTEKWSKIKGMHTDIPSICKALQLVVKHCDQDSIPVSFVTISEEVSNANLNRLEPSFMYTQLFKEILLEMEDDTNCIKVLTDYCREFYNGNARDSKIIDEFERDYRSERAIWWYTRECFAYRMLNQALRSLEGDTIINMGFFIRDLHRQIQQLHTQQAKQYDGKLLIVYRGQGLSKTDFEKLMKTKGGLMSFNNFLSTSEERDVSLRFARYARSKTDTVGILFQMTIPPSVLSTPFASISKYSYHKAEKEILFSMHAVFRVKEITKIDIDDSLYEVSLKLTTENDPELRILTLRIRQEIVGTTGWERLAYLLIQLNQLDTAEGLCNILPETNYNSDQEALRNHQLAHIRGQQGNYNEALSLYEKNLEICQKTLPANHPSLATCYGNMAGVYCDMGEYSKALSFYEKNLEICQKTLPANHPLLATSYNNIGGLYYCMRCYVKSLTYYERARSILQISLPTNHPHLKTLQQNIEIAKRYQ